jgi:hypothetical protein
MDDVTHDSHQGRRQRFFECKPILSQFVANVRHHNGEPRTPLPLPSLAYRSALMLWRLGSHNELPFMTRLAAIQAMITKALFSPMSGCFVASQHLKISEADSLQKVNAAMHKIIKREP